MRQEIDMNDWERRSAQAWAEIDDYYTRGEAGEADFREHALASPPDPDRALTPPSRPANTGLDSELKTKVTQAS